MKFRASKRAVRLFATLALLLFASDLIADEVDDLLGKACAAQTTRSGAGQEKTPCPRCSCAIHLGAVVSADLAFRLIRPLPASLFLGEKDDGAPPRLAVSIDLPPQLA